MKTASVESNRMETSEAWQRLNPRVDIEVVAWRPSEDGWFEWFGSQNHQTDRFLELGLKTGSARPVQPDWREGGQIIGRT